MSTHAVLEVRKQYQRGLITLDELLSEYVRLRLQERIGWMDLTLVERVALDARMGELEHSFDTITTVDQVCAKMRKPCIFEPGWSPRSPFYRALPR